TPSTHPRARGWRRSTPSSLAPDDRRGIPLELVRSTADGSRRLAQLPERGLELGEERPLRIEDVADGGRGLGALLGGLLQVPPDAALRAERSGDLVEVRGELLQVGHRLSQLLRLEELAR